VLWNIDQTLVDVGIVARDACAAAFRKVTGRPLVALPQMAGRTDSEVFFEALALNAPDGLAAGGAAEELLARYTGELGAAYQARAGELGTHGHILPGAEQALAGLAELPGTVQSVLTGTIRAAAEVKLAAFGLDRLLDTAIGGYGCEPYPKGAQLLAVRGRAGQKYGTEFGPANTVYIADSARDVEAARIGGARSLAVASGRSSAAELRDAGADAVLPALSPARQLAEAIERLTS
jgi:phosphoglycolate phosphatase